MNVLEVPREWSRSLCVVTDVSENERQAYLTEAELARLFSFPREKRRAEWAASRVAAKLLVLALDLCENPRQCSIVSSYRKPVIKLDDVVSPGRPVAPSHSLHVSISHSEGAGAAAIDSVPVGLDIQQVRPLNPRITKFYLKDNELTQLRTTTVEYPLIHFWCAKEAAYKLRAGRGWLKRVSIDLTSESPEGLTFALSYPVEGAVETFRVNGNYIAAVARRLRPAGE